MGVAAKMVGVATTTTAAGVTPHRVLVCLRGPPRGNFGPTTGTVGRGSGGGNKGRRNGARGRSAWAGSSISSGSSSSSSTDHSEVVVVADKEVSRAIADGASGPEASNLLLRLLITHFDGVDTEEGYTKSHTFGMCNGMPFSGFSGKFRVLMPTATGSERVLFPGTDVVFEVVRVAANEQYPVLLAASYPGSKATDPRPYASLNAMWRAFSDKQDTCRQRRNLFFLSMLLRRERGHPLRRGPGPPIMGAARAECRPSRFRGRRNRAIIQLLRPSNFLLTLGLPTHPPAGH